MNGIKRTYYITREIEDKLREIAFREKTTLSNVVRHALESYSLKEYENAKTQDRK